MGRKLLVKILLLSAIAVSQEDLSGITDDGSETQPPYWKTDKCKERISQKKAKEIGAYKIR